MHRTLFLILCFQCASFVTKSQSLPPYEEVVEHFFANYDAASYPHWQLHFEKRPNGYFIGFTSTPHGEIEKRYPLYQEGKYLSIAIEELPKQEEELSPYPTASDAGKNYISKIGFYQLENFDRYPCFGYDGWYMDAITWATQKADLSLDELHVLARAHSQSALALLPDIRGYALPEEVFQFSDVHQRMSEDQVTLYLNRTYKAIEVYKQLLEQDDNYITPVGPVRTKLANEYMTAFLTLLQYVDRSTAAPLLTDIKYDEYLLVQARNFLRACPSDAVLITYGDTDTYPLLYVQASENLRTDVIIANSSMIETARYRAMICKGPLNAKALVDFPEFPITPNSIITPIWVQGSATRTGTMSADMFELLIKETTTLEASDQYQLPNTTVTIPPPSSDELAIANLPLDTIEWHPFINKYYLTQGQLFQWHIIQAHNWERPLCFLPTNRYEIFKSWDLHLASRGLVYQVYPHTFTENGPPYIKSFTPEAFDFWQTTMDFDTETNISAFDKAPIYQMQLIEALFLTGHLIAEEKSDEARKLLESLPKRYPNTVKPWSTIWVMFAEQAQKLDLQKTQTLIINTIANNIESGLLADERPESLIWIENKMQELKQ